MDNKVTPTNYPALITLTMVFFFWGFGPIAWNINMTSDWCESTTTVWQEILLSRVPEPWDLATHTQLLISTSSRNQVFNGKVRNEKNKDLGMNPSPAFLMQKWATMECMEYILLSLGIISTGRGSKPCELKKARDSFAVDFEWQSPRRVYRRKSRHRVLENAR